MKNNQRLELDMVAQAVIPVLQKLRGRRQPVKKHGLWNRILKNNLKMKTLSGVKFSVFAGEIKW